MHTKLAHKAHSPPDGQAGEQSWRLTLSQQGRHMRAKELLLCGQGELSLWKKFLSALGAVIRRFDVGIDQRVQPLANSAHGVLIQADQEA